MKSDFAPQYVKEPISSLSTSKRKFEPFSGILEFKKAELYAKVKGRQASRQAIAFIAGIGDRAEVVSGDFDLLISKEKEVAKLKSRLEDVLKNETDKALMLTALSEISIELLKQKQGLE